VGKGWGKKSAWRPAGIGFEIRPPGPPWSIDKAFRIGLPRTACRAGDASRRELTEAPEKPASRQRSIRHSCARSSGRTQRRKPFERHPTDPGTAFGSPKAAELGAQGVRQRDPRRGKQTLRRAFSAMQNPVDHLPVHICQPEVRALESDVSRLW